MSVPAVVAMAASPVVRLLTLGFLTMFVASAIKGLYQVYFADLAVHFGRGRAEFALSGVLFMLATGLVSPLVGVLADRLGPLRTVTVGALAGGCALAGVVLCADSLRAFVLLYGLLAAFALAAMTYVPMGVLVDRVVGGRERAFAFAVVSNGTAVGFIVLSPLWIWLQRDTPWQTVFLTVGLLLALPLAAALYATARRMEPRHAPPSGAPPGADGWLRVLRERRFWVLALSFLSCGATMAFIDVHLVALWQGEGLPRVAQAGSLSLLGVLELGSGLFAGWLALRYNKAVLLAAFYLLRCIAVAVLLLPGAHHHGYLFASVFGASYLGTVVLTSAMCFDLYGERIKGQVFGLLFLAHQIGAVLAVQVGAAEFDRTRGYADTVVLLVGLTALAAVFSLVLIRGASRERHWSLA